MKINVNGMSVEDIMKLSQADIGRLSRQDLAKVTSRLASAANKRIKRAVGTPYEQTILHRAGNATFSVKGKNQGQLQGEFARARNFLQKKTSSVSGASKVFNAAMRRIGASTEEQSKELWRRYNKLKEFKPDLFENNKEWGSDRIQQMIRLEMNQSRIAGVELSPDIAFERVLEVMDAMLKQEAVEYAEEEEQYNQFDDSGFFNLGENPWQR